MTIVEQIEREIAVLEAQAERMRELLQDAKAAAADIAAIAGGADVVVPIHQPELAQQADGEGESMPPPVGANGDGSKAEATPSRRAKRSRGGPDVAAKASRSAAQRDGRAASHASKREEILAYVRANPGQGPSEIAEGIGCNPSTVHTHLQSLVSARGDAKKLRVERDREDARRRCYFPIEADVAPADSDGARTGDERRLVAAVRAAPSPPTTSEAAKNAGVGSIDAAGILSGLARRGVLREVPRKEDHHPRRWGLPVEAVAA